MSDQSPAQSPNPKPASPGALGQQPPPPAQAVAPPDPNAPDKVKPEPEPELTDSVVEAAEEQRTNSGALRRDITAAAANPGNTATTRKLRDEGLRQLGVVNSLTSTDFQDPVNVQRDLIGRDNITTNIYAATPDPYGHYEITVNARQEISEIYVEPKDFGTLVSFCAERRITVIRVTAGQGKLITALRVLDRICTGPLFKLDPAKGMTQLRRKDIAENGGYLLTGLTQSQADFLLTRHEMDRLDTELNDRAARLVITVTAETRLTYLGSTDYVTDLTHRPEGHDVFAAHLRVKLSEDMSERLIADADVAAILDTELHPGIPPRKAVLLAGLTADAARDSGDPREIAATVRYRLAARSSPEFADWFQGLGGLAEHSFVIALAVLNGLPYETVAQAGRALEARLTAPVTGRLEDLPRDQVRPFEHRRSMRLKTFHAKLTSGTASTPQGEVPVQTVEFDDPTCPKQVLTHVWQEYDQAHSALIDWLYKLGSHAVEEVRTRAGVAVGALSTNAFEFMRNSIVEPWACSTDHLLRESAATALDAANSVPYLKDTVQGLVHEWSADSKPELVATAVRAYGSSVGVDQPARLFETLNQHAESPDFTVVGAVCASLAELAEAGVVGVSDRALMTAREWTRSRTRVRRVTGKLAFLMMAADLMWTPDAAPPRQGRTGRIQHWPLLLKLADSSPEWRQVIAIMWATALTSADIAELALGILDQWAETAESDDQRQRALVRLLAATTTSDRVRARLRRTAERWADPDSTMYAPKIAAAVRASKFLPVPEAMVGDITERRNRP
ncbi:MAG: hypothetical protein ACRDTG_26930 [Pseudonocardiaceae bacterium]